MQGSFCDEKEKTVVAKEKNPVEWKRKYATSEKANAAIKDKSSECGKKLLLESRDIVPLLKSAYKKSF